ncbi:MAG TPA: ATP-binding protein, partial [Steroidobacteraceae bacterium]|nr:ATP-binding protein [Steroidobacteraceae bacterium]
MRRLGDDGGAIARPRVIHATAAVVLAVIATLLLLAQVSKELATAREAHQLVQQERAHVEIAHALIVSLLNAQLAQGRFVITGDARFIVSYTSAESSLTGLMSGLGTLGSDAESRKLIETISESVEEHRRYMQQVVEMRQSGDASGAVELVRRAGGNQRLDRIQSLVQQLEARKQSQLRNRLLEFESRSEGAERIVQGTLIAASILVLLAGGLLVRHQRREFAAHILAQQVAGRLATTEAAYREQATRLAAILDSAIDAIITVNEGGSIESWSKSAQRLLGYEAHEVVGKSFSMLMAESDTVGRDGLLQRHLSAGESRTVGTRREVDALHKNGRRVPVDLAFSEMRIDSTRLFVGVLRDLTERVEMERLKSGFVSTVSHELRTPVTSIAGSLGLLAGGVAGEMSPQATRLLEIARQNCDRLVRLISDILDVDRAQTGALEVKSQQQPLAPIVQHAIEMNRAYAQRLGVNIELQSGSSAEVMVDRERLIQVLTNLLSNAAKFSPNGGTVRVHMRERAGCAEVLVEDDGPGIAPAFHTRIFQKFAQADSSDSRAKGGTGLGLSIARTIVEQLGGRIDFDRERRSGTCFIVSLPTCARVDEAVGFGRSAQACAVL